MPFKKQDININIKGRPIGATNKTTAELKTLLVSVFENNLNEIILQQDKLSLNERLLLNKTLLQYILPSLRNVPFSNNLETSILDVNW